MKRRILTTDSLTAILLIALLWPVAFQSGTLASPAPFAPQGEANGAWTLVTSPTSSRLKSVDMVSADEGWAVGDDGSILHYAPGGWNIEYTGSYTLSAVSMISPAEGWAVGGVARNCGDYHGGGCGLLQHYLNGTWLPPQIYTSTASVIQFVSMVSADDGWAIDLGTYSSGSRIFRYGNGAWQLSGGFGGSGTCTMRLRSVAMVSATEGWAVGALPSDYFVGKICHYTSGTWLNAPSPATKGLKSVAMVSPAEGWAVGYGGAIIHYDNGSWQSISSPITNTLNSVKMVSASEGWAVGDSGVILHYSDGNWQSVPSPTGQDLYSVAIVSAGDAWAVGAGGVILRYRAPVLQTSTNEVTRLMRPDDADVTATTVQMANVGFGSLNWTANVTPTSWLGFSPITSTLSSGLPTTATVTIAKAGLSPGWNTGEIVVNSNGGDATITVRAFLGDVRRMIFPLVMKGATVGN